MKEIDHIIVFVEPDGQAVRAALAAGLVQTHSRAHVGQGTENACFAFGDTFIELLWCRDRREIDSAPVARTGLAGRSRWRTLSACPFGVCLRTATPPFPTWTYDVPFPPGMSAAMSLSTDRIDEPLIFAMAPMPGRGAAPKSQPLGQHITAIALAFQIPDRPSPAIEALAAMQIDVHHAATPRMTVTIDEGQQGRQIDITDTLTLAL